jgi:hypothetical protein
VDRHEPAGQLSMDGELDPPALQKHRVAHHRWRATLQKLRTRTPLL